MQRLLFGEDEARLLRWREYMLTQRVETIVHAGFWPLVPGWSEGLLGPDFGPPEWECVWPYPRPFPLPMWPRADRLRLVRKDGKVVGEGWGQR
jgi:hypothetical protein